MTDQSRYLAMALQQIGAQPAQGVAPQGPNVAGLQRMAQDRQAWEAANPGQSYMAHGIAQMGQNLANAPGRVADAFGSLGQVPGQALSGLQALVQRFGGGGMPATTNI